jgi:hypothetical protein
VQGDKILTAFRIFDNFVSNGEIGPEPSPNIFEVVAANQAIEAGAERTKDQMKRQLQSTATTLQAELQKTLNLVFGGAASTSQILSVDDARRSLPFQLANSGAYLRRRPDLRTITDTVERNLKNVVVSRIIEGMKWQFILDDTVLVDDPADPGGACRGNKGFADVGARCGGFKKSPKISSFDEGRPNDPRRLETLIDVRAMFNNALRCDGQPRGTNDFFGLDFNPSLPPCIYNFPIEPLET